MTLLISHRGSNGGHPESTMSAFTSALKLDSCDGVEIDVRKSKDGVFFVLHDNTLERTAREDIKHSSCFQKYGNTDVSLLDWNTIIEIDVGIEGESAPLVSAVIQEVIKHNKHIVIEFKMDGIQTKAEKLAFVNDFLSCHDSLLTSRQCGWNSREKVFFISFDFETLRFISNRLPDHHCIFLLHVGDQDGRKLEFDDLAKMKQVMIKCKDSGFYGIQTDLFAFETYPTLIDELRDHDLKAGVYVSDDRSGSEYCTGDRSEKEHRWMQNNLFIFTSDMPTYLISDPSLWPSHRTK
eukprot:GHVH01001773.1.p1 GENE.GHVH01001773.1~~GHVH01001773.1.p1  ORF type:complete len:294 (+),score=39.23 GHVH01001773.1:96-977(+)